MRPRLLAVLMVLVVVAGMVSLDLRPVQAGQEPSTSGYKVLEPIRHGSLTVFPVVASRSYATGDFLTLDEGLRSGDVVVTEYGNVSGLIRRRPAPAVQVQAQRAEVNRLVLINNSKRPLLLLAGEIVTGGKQDRVIGKDRIVPPESDPVDLGVFCVEPGRWVASSEHFGTSGATYGGSPGGAIHGAVVPGTMMAQPSVRAKAMGDKDQSRGLGGSAKATAVDDSRGCGCPDGLAREHAGDPIHQFLRAGDGEQRREGKSGRDCCAHPAEL